MSCEDFFCSTTAQRGANFVKHLVFGGDGALLRGIPSSTEGLSTGHNGDLYERIGILQEPGHCGVTGFMNGDGAFLVLCHHFGLLFKSSNNTVNGIKEILLAHCFLVSTGCDESSFITNIGNVGS